jgi:hypothetical protein
METLMKRLELDIVCMASLPLLASGFALAADDSKVKAGTRQVENGAKEDSREQGRGRPEGNGQRGRQDGFRRSEVQLEKGEGSCEIAGTPMLATPIKNTTRVSRSSSTSGISAVEIARQARADMT